MSSSNGNIFRVTGSLCGEFTGGQRRGALMISLICVWINGWINNREAGDLRHYRSHYDVIIVCHLDVDSLVNTNSFSCWVSSASAVSSSDERKITSLMITQPWFRLNNKALPESMWSNCFGAIGLYYRHSLCYDYRWFNVTFSSNFLHSWVCCNFADPSDANRVTNFIWLS